jgi:hypothetical protein
MRDRLQRPGTHHGASTPATRSSAAAAGWPWPVWAHLVFALICRCQRKKAQPHQEGGHVLAQHFVDHSASRYLYSRGWAPRQCESSAPRRVTGGARQPRGLVCALLSAIVAICGGNKNKIDRCYCRPPWVTGRLSSRQSALTLKLSLKLSLPHVRHVEDAYEQRGAAARGRPTRRRRIFPNRPGDQPARSAAGRQGCTHQLAGSHPGLEPGKLWIPNRRSRARQRPDCGRG